MMEEDRELVKVGKENKVSLLQIILCRNNIVTLE